MSDAPLLRPGARGDAVVELQSRLRSVGSDLVADGEYGPETTAAVRSFQERRRLRVDGICGPETWGALEESGYALSDRLLCRRTPMLRGDDVVALQSRLNALGFDAGRADGIFGPQTESALRAFQHEAGIAVDRICGPDTIAALDRLGAPTPGSVAATRERDALRRGPRELRGLGVLVTTDHAIPLADEVGGRLRLAGAEVTVLGTEDPGEIARVANETGVDLLVHLTESDQNLTQCAFFENASMRSEGGYRVAAGITETIRATGIDVATPAGRTSRILRETRMPAVTCELAGVGDNAIAEAIARGVSAAIEGSAAS